jgi:hypothetical protein
VGQLAVDCRLKAEPFGVGKPRQPQPAVPRPEPARLPFGHQRLASELRVFELAFGGLLAQAIELGRQMFELELNPWLRAGKSVLNDRNL